MGTLEGRHGRSVVTPPPPCYQNPAVLAAAWHPRTALENQPGQRGRYADAAAERSPQVTLMAVAQVMGQRCQAAFPVVQALQGQRHAQVITIGVHADADVLTEKPGEVEVGTTRRVRHIGKGPACAISGLRPDSHETSGTQNGGMMRPAVPWTACQASRCFGQCHLVAPGRDISPVQAQIPQGTRRQRPSKGVRWPFTPSFGQIAT